MARLSFAPWFRKLLGKGVNKDIAPELIEGARSMFHVRPTSTTGATGGIEAVGGEQLLYNTNIPGQDTYVYIGGGVVNRRVVEFWASTEPDTYNPIIRIDGVVAAQSPNIPYTHDRPLQVAIETRCRGGIIYPADHQSLPLYWDVQDMLDNVDNATYFGDYTTDYNSVGLSAPSEFPRFVRLVPNVSGLPMGQYIYSLRYVTPAGDRTNQGPETPPISVPRVQDFVFDTIYPLGRTTGGQTDILNGSQYGVVLKFRIDNTQGYESVEVCRQRFNDGQGLSSPGITEVVIRIPLEPGQFDIIEVTDTTTETTGGEFAVIPPEPITPDEVSDQLITLNAPKSVELSDNRLLYANDQIPSVVPEFTFTPASNGQNIVPITQRLTTWTADGTERNSGHNDPYNLTYYRSFMRGEKYGIGIQGWDGNLAKLAVAPVPGAENFAFPNRRDPKGPLGPYGLESLQQSTDSIDAANTQCQSDEPVSPTFDAYTQGNKARTQTDGFANVAAVGSLPFAPLLPISPSDTNTNTSGWNIPPQIRRSGVGLNAPDTGQIFDPRYHALGGLIPEISNIPPNVKAITIARTEPANNVVVQGIGMWNMRDGTVDEGRLVQRSSNSIRCHFPDIESGIVPQSVLDDIIENPSNYEFQLVGYQGFYQDVYGYDTPPSSPSLAWSADTLLYAYVQRDEGQVNVLAPAGGYSPGPNSTSPAGNYVGPAKWRNTDLAGQENLIQFFANPEQGNARYGITSLSISEEGRGDKYILTSFNFIYSPNSQALLNTGSLDSDAQRLRAQPVYTVNIIRRGANVPDQTTQRYINTGETIRAASTVGIMPSGSPATIRFELLNERLEDVRPYVFGDTVGSLRYIWIKEPGQPERAWVNLTNMASTIVDQGDVIDAIIADGFWVSPDGTRVYGTYQVRSSPQFLTTGSEFSPGVTHFIEFGSFSTPGSVLPPEGTRITVKSCFKNIRFFGGDTFLGEQIYSPYDGQYTVRDGATARSGGLTLNNAPMPMYGFVRSPLYVIPRGPGTVQASTDIAAITQVRQIAVMWAAETRTSRMSQVFTRSLGPFAGIDHPRCNYILRPFNDVNLVSGAANGFFPQYDQLYEQLLGANPANEFFFGGIQYRRRGLAGTFNYDYSRQPNITFIGVPEVGFEERNDLCNAIFASNEVDPSQQDQPGLRTFLSSNIKLLSQENGEIKVIASALGGNSGRNIYAWTQQGVSLVLTNKNILTDASGEQIATQETSDFWGREIILTKGIGLPDQMWRLFTKAYAPTGSGYADSFFWMDRKGAYRLTGNNIVDISRDRYLSELLPSLQVFPTDYSLNVGSLYNPKDNEVWFGISEQFLPPDPPSTPTPTQIPPRLFVYNALRNEWIDKFGFQFDNYLANEQTLYGFRDLQTYDLDKGDVVNGLVREAKVMVPFFGDVGKFKQLLRWRITPSGELNSARPDEIRVYDEGMNLLSIQNEALAAAIDPAEAQYWVLWYDGWEQYAACSPASIDPQERPPQSHGFFVELIWKSRGYKSLLAVSSQLQNIR